MKYFRIEEAESLIPQLETLFSGLREIGARAQDRTEALRKLEEDEVPSAAQIALEKAQLEFLTNEMNDRFAQIFELGVLPKGYDPALVDFPFQLDGTVVYLCWKLGEKNITHYHGSEEGFAGRKPLPRVLH